MRKLVVFRIVLKSVVVLKDFSIPLYRVEGGELFDRVISVKKFDLFCNASHLVWKWPSPNALLA